MSPSSTSRNLNYSPYPSFCWLVCCGRSSCSGCTQQPPEPSWQALVQWYDRWGTRRFFWGREVVSCQSAVLIYPKSIWHNHLIHKTFNVRKDTCSACLTSLTLTLWSASESTTKKWEQLSHLTNLGGTPIASKSGKSHHLFRIWIPGACDERGHMFTGRTTLGAQKFVTSLASSTTTGRTLNQRIKSVNAILVNALPNLVIWATTANISSLAIIALVKNNFRWGSIVSKKLILWVKLTLSAAIIVLQDSHLHCCKS